MRTYILASFVVVFLMATGWCLKSEYRTIPPIQNQASVAIQSTPAARKLAGSGMDDDAHHMRTGGLPVAADSPSAFQAKDVPSTVVAGPVAPAPEFSSRASTPRGTQTPRSSASTSIPSVPAIPGAQQSNFHPAASPLTWSAAASSAGNQPTSNAEQGALEVDPGVPLPAAFFSSPNTQESSAVAAARQQLADSFVQDVNAAISQPATTDATASDAYYKAKNRSDELYRSLFGVDAYIRAGIQSAIDAMAPSQTANQTKK